MSYRCIADILNSAFILLKEIGIRFIKAFILTKIVSKTIKKLLMMVIILK